MQNIPRRFAASPPPPAITLNEVGYSRTVYDPDDAYCSVSFNADGTVTGVADGASGYAWLVDGVPGDYSVLLTTASGMLSTGSAGVWQNLGISKTFSVERTFVGSKSWVGTIQIRRDSDLAIMAGPTNTSFVATVVSSGGSEGGSGGGGRFGSDGGLVSSV